MRKQTPSKFSYEQALEIVKAYEKRQNQLKDLQHELSTELSMFNSVSFKIDKKEEEVIFSGYLESVGKVLIGRSKCAKEDLYEEVIGKLIAVKLALGEDVKGVVELVEPSHTFFFQQSTKLSDMSVFIDSQSASSTWVSK